MAHKIKSELIRLSKCSISLDEKKAVNKVLDSEFLGMGPEVNKFEEELSSFFGRKAIATVNGTAALHLALQCANINTNHSVLVPSLTYIASFQSITAAGATPIACDVLEDSLLLDLKDAENKLTNNTKAIMPVHYSGGVGDLSKVYDFAENYNLRVIEDAAHAFGSTYNGKKVGSFGDIACFSFDGIKNITSGEGGVIITDDQKVIKKAMDARLLGVINDSKKRYLGGRSWMFNSKEQGWRYHMSDIMAAIGRVQLKKFPLLLAKRRKLAIHYDKLFSNSNRIITLDRDYNTVVPHIYPIRVKNLNDRENLKEQLLKRNIQVGYHYFPNHWLDYYKESNNHLPVTESVFPELLTLPLHPDLEESDVEYVVSEITKILG